MIIYSDGSAHPNPGPGGYGVVFFDDNNKYIRHYCHQEADTTNNIQELKGLIFSFIYASLHPEEDIIIYSDSSYAISVFTDWAEKWEWNGWRKGKNEKIKNLDLIKEGYNLYKKLKNCKIIKIKGHNNIIGNELADALATNNAVKVNRILKEIQ